MLCDSSAWRSLKKTTILAQVIEKRWLATLRQGVRGLPVDIETFWSMAVFFWKNSAARHSNHLSVHQWIRSAIHDSQQLTSPIGFVFLKLPPPLCAVLLVYTLQAAFKILKPNRMWLRLMDSEACSMCGGCGLHL